jgi:S-DNA-T family DNA segregation ATPase FtsK/SpoIIIE
VSERSSEVSFTVATGGHKKDVTISAPTSRTAGEVVDELTRHVGATKARAPALARTNAAIPREVPWASALAQGDVIDLDGRGAAGAAASADAAVELVVVGGPSAGRRMPLQPGSQVLGRAGHADIGLDDGSVSREHARLDVEGTTVRVTDLRSRNGTFIEGQAITSTEVLEPGRVLEVGSTLLSVETGGTGPSGPDRVADGRIPFNRPPRLQAPYQPPTINLPAPPKEPTPRRFAIGTAVIPLIMGLALFAITQQPATLLFALLSPSMLAYAALDDRRSGRRTFRKDTDDFRAAVATAAAQAADARRDEADSLRAAYPDLGELVARAVERDDRLWERRPDDPDHLHVRVGAADRPSAVTVDIARGGSDDLRSEAVEATGGTANVASVPIVVDLAAQGPLGIVGPRTITAPLARALVTELSTLHAPSDVAVAIAAPGTVEDDWAWASWLPHTDRQRASVPFPLLAGENEDLRALASGIAERTTTAPVVALVVDGVADLAPWTAALDAGAEGGCVVVWLAEHRRELPNRCRSVLECREGAARLVAADGAQIDDIVIDGVAPDVAERTARALAPVVEVSGRDGSAVPREVRLLETLAMDGDLADEIERRWANAVPGAVAPIGREAQGTFEIDLDRDGPHAVIGGTPGSGKSALLLSWLASLAAAYPPNLVTFLIIDFKGEAAARQLAGLPHLVGVATDLTPDLTRRALLSLGAELQRRERILGEAEGKPDNMLPVMREQPELAPPKLVVVIDEFAALKDDVPELMHELEDIARRGRSLGMHLVLAAQDPSTSQVGATLLRNINLRLCLRVVDRAVSQDLVQVPDAALLSSDQVGRALVRSGVGGPLHLVQVAHGFAAAETADDLAGRIVISERRVTGPTAAGPRTPRTSSELAALVAAVGRAAERTGAHAPAAPWLPPLPSLLPLADVPPVDGPHRVAIGLVDRPAAQRQDPLAVDLESHGAVAVFGTARSGKSTVLRTVAAALASAATPKELNLYGLDFGSGGLAVLESLPHCGAVVQGADDERVRRLLRQLTATVQTRRRQLAESGASGLTDLQARTGTALPRVVLLLDEYGGFASAYERVDPGQVLDAVPRLIAEGPGVGVQVILTVDRRGGLPMAVHGAITRRIVLPLATADEQSALGIDPRLAPGRSQGRAIVEDQFEAQVAVVGDHGDAASQADAIRALGADLAARHPGHRAAGISTLPSELSSSELPAPATPLRPAVAVGDAALGPVELDLADGHVLIAGPHRSGRTTSLATVAAQLTRASESAELVLLSPRRTTLTEHVHFARTATGDACQDLASTLAAEVELRRDDGTERPLVVLVDDIEELFDTPASAALERVARRGRDRDVRIVAACESRSAKTFSGVVPELRKSRRGLLLMPDLALDGDILSVQLPHRLSITFVPGRGFLVDRGQLELVQVASP